MLADERNVQIVDANLESVSGLVTLIKDVPVTINLNMYNMNGEPYTEDTLNKHIWSFIVAHDYNSKTKPQLRASAISVSGNVLKIEINNMNTVELNEQLKEEKSVRLGAELYGKSLDDNKDNWVIQFNVSIRNRRESNGIPTNVESNYYTKGEVDAKIDGITLDVPTKVSELENDAGYITIEQVPEVDLTPYALKSEIPDVSNFITADALSVYALKSEIPVVDVNKTYVDTELAKKANSSDIPFVPSVVSAFTNDAGYITLSDVPEQDLSVYALKSEIPDVSAFITADALTPYALKTELPVVDVDKAYVDAELAKKLNTTDAFSGDYNDLSNKPTIPVLPENITTLGNDVNTAGGLVQVAEDGKIPADLYDAGSSGSSYTAGSGINISNDSISVDLSNYSTTKIKIGATETSDTNILSSQSNFSIGNIKGKYKPVIVVGSAVIAVNKTNTGTSNNFVGCWLGTHIVNGGTVTNSYVANCIITYSTYSAVPSITVQGGNYHTIKLTAGTACTLTTSSAYYLCEGDTIMVVVDNSNAGSLLFGGEEVISTSETGKYALVFANIAKIIKLYNKIEV